MKAQFVYENLDFGREVYNIEESTLLFLEGEITMSQWEYSFNTLYESKVGDFINDKIYPVLKTVVKKMKGAGKKSLEILKKIYAKIKGLATKYPKTFKFVTMMIVLLLVASVNVAAQATGGDPSPEYVNYVNAVIGFLQDIGQDNLDMITFDWQMAQAHLVDMRDGALDDPALINDGVENIVDVAMRTIDKINADGGIPKSLIDKGEAIIDYAYKLGGSRQEINLISK